MTCAQHPTAASPSEQRRRQQHSFYRATLCVNAVFAVGLCLFVRPSVRLSRSCIVSRRLNISSDFFLGSVAPSFLVFDPGVDTQELLHLGR